MEAFLEREEATTSQLFGILPGSPPRVNLVDYGTGIKRHITQQVPILDKYLCAKLEAEVNVGDYIRATAVNEYTKDGNRFYLAEFQRVNTVALSGTNGVKSSGTTQFSLATPVIKLILLDKTKVQK